VEGHFFAALDEYLSSPQQTSQTSNKKIQSPLLKYFLHIAADFLTRQGNPTGFEDLQQRYFSAGDGFDRTNFVQNMLTIFGMSQDAKFHPGNGPGNGLLAKANSASDFLLSAATAPFRGTLGLTPEDRPFLEEVKNCENILQKAEELIAAENALQASSPPPSSLASKKTQRTR